MRTIVAGVIRNTEISLEFKKEDTWVGTYWDVDEWCIELWICLIPTLPIHFKHWRPNWVQLKNDVENNDVENGVE